MQNNMKIAMVSKFYNKYQGIPRVVSEISEILCENHEVHVYARHWDTSDWDVAERKNITFHKIPSLGKDGFWNELLFFFYSGFALRGSKYDIVNIHDVCFYFGGIFTCHSFSQGGSKTISGILKFPWYKEIYMFRSEILRYPLTNFNIKRRKTKKIIAVSGLVKGLLVKYAKRKPENIAVIHNGVDLASFHPRGKEIARARVFEELGLQDDDFLISFVGHYLQRKGLGLLFAALKVADNPKIKVVVVGESVEDVARLNSMVGSVIPKEQVFSVGAKKNVEDVKNYMAASDLFVLPSGYEPFGNVVLEAMACHVPVIVSNTTGAAEVVEHGVNGFVLEALLDHEAFAGHINTMVNNPELRKSMGQSAFKTAEKNTWKHVVNKTLDVFDKTVEAVPE
ncbi:MAG: hypothetical protein COA42_23960 [Alteromonadaceae bacterium]|nr:MAG: hypothetical protein COA42_23960 [Alteromonadaceae bacterium]